MNYKINARHLIVDLLYASKDSTASIKRILYAAQILGISENGVRVAVSRLNQENVIHMVERGIYKLVEKKFDTSVISLMKSPQMQLAETWSGDYNLIYAGHLGRVDRTALARREKILSYFGFKELEQNLYIRPDNLGLKLEELKNGMIQFGFEPEARIFQVNQLQNEAEIKRLWDVRSLHKKYWETIEHVNQWFETSQLLTLEESAVSAFHIAKTCIFILRADPLLPSKWIDVELRRQCELSTQKIENIGQQLWQDIFRSKQI